MTIQLHNLGRVDYLSTMSAMQNFTAQRLLTEPDQIWFCEHDPVYTLGLAGDASHILNAQAIPVIQSNRGGQVTFHGPGQVIAYPLLNLQRAGYYVKEFVYRVEDAVLRTLDYFKIVGHRVIGAPGIYVRLDDPYSHRILEQRPQHQSNQSVRYAPDFTGLGKIAALGIKVSRHCTYHGVALNVDMDLSPFKNINPCGYTALQTVDLSTIGVQVTWEDVASILGQHLCLKLTP
jgi:lipoyl(octanoyl) transferase